MPEIFVRRQSARRHRHHYSADASCCPRPAATCRWPSGPAAPGTPRPCAEAGCCGAWRRARLLLTASREYRRWSSASHLTAHTHQRQPEPPRCRPCSAVGSGAPDPPPRQAAEVRKVELLLQEALAEVIKYPRGGGGSVTDRVGKKRGGKANLPVLHRAWSRRTRAIAAGSRSAAARFDRTWRFDRAPPVCTWVRG